MSNEVRACRHDLSSENISLLLSSIRLLASARNVETFKSILLQIKGVSTSFYSYLETNYLCERWVTTFSEVNRGHLSLSTQRLCRSNMLTEVSFRTLKYIIFDGYINKRLDYLLYSISYKLYPYFAMKEVTQIPVKPRFLLSQDVKCQGTHLYK